MRVSGVYVFWDADGTCIYVGSSIDMHGRVKTNKHRKLAARVEFYHFPESELVDREHDFMQHLKPTLNKQVAARPNQPLGYCPQRDLRLVRETSYWSWEIYGIRISFRTIVEALDAFPLIKAIQTPELCAVTLASESSMNGRLRTATPSDLFATKL